MLAPARIPTDFEAWNRHWRAPFGPRLVKLPFRMTGALTPKVLWAVGPFAFQSNSPNRRYEYPWAYSTLPVEPGALLLEIGGALSGLQFVLSSGGCEVHNVDPLLDYGGGDYASSALERHAEINQRFGSSVKLHHATLSDCDDLPGQVDAVYSVSTLEHMGQDDIRATLSRAVDLLKPGGLVVLTVDLFLDVYPFEEPVSNRYGTNVSIAWIQEVLGFDLVWGEVSQLYGYPEFSVDETRKAAAGLLQHNNALCQLVVFRKPLGEQDQGAPRLRGS